MEVSCSRVRTRRNPFIFFQESGLFTLDEFLRMDIEEQVRIEGLSLLLANIQDYCRLFSRDKTEPRDLHAGNIALFRRDLFKKVFPARQAHPDMSWGIIDTEGFATLPEEPCREACAQKWIDKLNRD